MRDLLRAADAPGPDDLAARHDLLVAALLKRARAPHCSRCGAEAPLTGRCSGAAVHREAVAPPVPRLAPFDGAGY